MPGWNKFFRGGGGGGGGGGPIISEKLVPGGTNFRGVQIKRDRHVPERPKVRKQGRDDWTKQ